MLIFSMGPSIFGNYYQIAHSLQFLALFIFYFEGFTSIPTALTANDRNRRIQVYQASDG